MNPITYRCWMLGALAAAMGSAQSFGGETVRPPADKPATADHRHDPIVVEARPIVAKFRVPFVRPRRVLLAADGSLYVADWGAGTVVHLTADGKADVIAEDLNEPAGLAQDGMGHLYVSTHAGGMSKEGKIYKIGQNRMKEVFAEGLTGPTGLAFDMRDNLFVADFHENSIVQITQDGDVSTFVGNIPAPSDVIFDTNGDLLTCSSTEGIIYRITNTPMRTVTVVARGLNTPSDLSMDRKGRLVATCFGGGVLSHISKAGRVRTFAVVPKGTIAAIFDAGGNLVVANWTDHYLMKVTTRFTIPCPHCDRKIPVRLRTPRKPMPPRTESQPSAPPII